MSTQSISYPFNVYAAKEAYNRPVRGTDSNTAQAWSHAQMDSHNSGFSVGMNYFAPWKNEGVINRHPHIKERIFEQEKGYYPDATHVWIG